MKFPVLNINGEEVDTVELPASVFDSKINNGLMHQALVRQLANARAGTHKAKSRSEVRYSTRKIYRQKGTGRARHGSRRAPIFVGGGVAHGPVVRDHSVKMPRKMRQAALRSALTVKAKEGSLIFVDKYDLDSPKTREMRAALDRIVGDNSALVLLNDRDSTVEKSVRNLDNAKSLRVNYLNIRDLLRYEKVIVSLDALDTITQWLGA
ncbi:MAG: 50S ribosomal protein L4 [Chloroflexota bacterium]